MMTFSPSAMQVAGVVILPLSYLWAFASIATASVLVWVLLWLQVKVFTPAFEQVAAVVITPLFQLWALALVQHLMQLMATKMSSAMWLTKAQTLQAVAYLSLQKLLQRASSQASVTHKVKQRHIANIVAQALMQTPYSARNVADNNKCHLTQRQTKNGDKIRRFFIQYIQLGRTGNSFQFQENCKTFSYNCKEDSLFQDIPRQIPIW